MNRKALLASCLLWLVLIGPAFAQVGKDQDYWRWVEPSPAYENAMCRVDRAKDGILHHFGSAVIAEIDGRRVVVTAAHVCFMAVHGLPITNIRNTGLAITFADGSMVMVPDEGVVMADAAMDVAVVNVPIPADLPAIPVASEMVEAGDLLAVMGYGGTDYQHELRHFESRAAFPTDGKFICLDTPVLHGDSGGAILNARGELVGVMSCGLGVATNKEFSEGDETFRVLWPSQSCNVGALRGLLMQGVVF